jgi:membrane-bound inhibitor of C-type lysozyme
MGGYLYGEYRDDLDKVYPWIELKRSTTEEDLDIMNTETLEYMCKDYKVEIPLNTEYSNEEQKRNIIIERLVVCAKNLIGPYEYGSNNNNNQ